MVGAIIALLVVLYAFPGEKDQAVITKTKKATFTGDFSTMTGERRRILNDAQCELYGEAFLSALIPQAIRPSNLKVECVSLQFTTIEATLEFTISSNDIGILETIETVVQEQEDEQIAIPFNGETMMVLLNLVESVEPEVAADDTASPTAMSANPTENPTSSPTSSPSASPTASPTTGNPTASPITSNPTERPQWPYNNPCVTSSGCDITIGCPEGYRLMMNQAECSQAHSYMKWGSYSTTSDPTLYHGCLSGNAGVMYNDDTSRIWNTIPGGPTEERDRLLPLCKLK